MTTTMMMTTTIPLIIQIKSIKISYQHVFDMCVIFISGPHRRPIGENMKDQLARNKQVSMPVMTREGDTAKMRAIKILVERMTLPRAAHRCNITEACTALEREKGA